MQNEETVEGKADKQYASTRRVRQSFGHRYPSIPLKPSKSEFCNRIRPEADMDANRGSGPELAEGVEEVGF